MLIYDPKYHAYKLNVKVIDSEPSDAVLLKVHDYPIKDSPGGEELD